jgi:hypothetical protein
MNRYVKRAALCRVGVVLACTLTTVFTASAAGLAREQRPVAGVERVALRTVGDLVITQGADEALVVEAEPHLLGRISTRVSGGTLTIETTGPVFNTREPLRYLLRVKRIDAIESSASGTVRSAPLTADHMRLALAGSGELRIEGLDASALTVEAPGSGKVEIGRGSVEQASIRMAGAGEFAAPRLRMREARVDLSGSAAVVVAAEKSLSVTISGSGRVAYRGNPEVTQRIAGAGVVERAGPLQADR